MQSVCHPVEGRLWLTEPLTVNWGQDRQVTAWSHREAAMLPNDCAGSGIRLPGSILSLVTYLRFLVFRV